MKERHISRLLSVVILILVTALLVGSVLGQPVLLSYVETGSMEPALSPGDGFIAIPSAIAGDIEEGDVIVFRAEKLHGGDLTTHRVVKETQEGYITRGDANPSPDQAGNEPPVRNAQIVAEAFQIGGTVVVIPHLGTIVTGVQSVAGTIQQRFAGILGVGGRQSIAFLLLSVSILAYVVDGWRERTTTTRKKERSRDTGTEARLYVLMFVGAVVIAATGAMVVPSGPTEYGFVSSPHNTPGPGVIGVDETERATYRIDNPGVVPVVAFLETEGDGISVQADEVRVAPRDITEVEVTLTAPRQRGYYRKFVVDHRYLALLPNSVIRALYHVHPWLPIVVVDALLGGAFYGLGLALVGTGKVRSRDRGRPAGGSLDRLVRGLYR